MLYWQLLLIKMHLGYIQSEKKKGGGGHGDSISMIPYFPDLRLVESLFV